MTTFFVIVDFRWSRIVRYPIWTVLLCFKLKLGNLFVEFWKHPPGEVSKRSIYSLSESKESHAADAGPKMVLQKGFIGYFPKRDPKMQIHKQNGMKSALFCFGGHLKIFKTVQTLKIFSEKLRYFNLNQLSSRSVQIRALSLIQQVFPFRGEHPTSCQYSKLFYSY